MLLKEILSQKGKKVWSIKANQTLREAIEVLVAQKIGALLVFNERTDLAGIVSERDILRECFNNSKGWETLLVSDVMSKNLIIGTPEDEVDYIMGIMTQNRVRHVPVLREKKLEGIISIGDVVKALLKQSQYENRYLKEYLYGS